MLLYFKCSSNVDQKRRKIPLCCSWIILLRSNLVSVFNKNANKIYSFEINLSQMKEHLNWATTPTQYVSFNSMKWHYDFHKYSVCHPTLSLIYAISIHWMLFHNFPFASTSIQLFTNITPFATTQMLRWCV